MTYTSSAYDEKQRILSIQGLGRKFKMPENVVQQAIDDGDSLEDFKGVALRWIEKSPPKPLGGVSNDNHLGLTKKDIGQYSLAKAINAATEGPFKLEGLEREIHDELYKKLPQAQRSKSRGVLIPAGDLDWGFSKQRSFYNSRGTLNTQSFEYGGALVPTDHLGDRFIDSLQNRSRVLSLGVTILPGLTGDVSIPKNIGDVSTFWILENSVIPESEMNFGQVTLKPRTIGTIASFSRNLAVQSDPSIETILKQNLVSQLAIGLDRTMLYGSGINSAEPRGLVNIPGVQSVIAGDPNGGPLSYELLAEMEAKIYGENADGEAMAWLVNSQVRKAARTTTENASNVSKWIWTDGQNGDGFMLGYPAAISENVAKNSTKGSGTNLSHCFFGNWSDLIVGQWGTIELLPNLMGRTFQTGGIELRILFSCDFAVRNAESFVVCTDLATA